MIRVTVSECLIYTHLFVQREDTHLSYRDYEESKCYRGWRAENVWRTFLLGRFNRWNAPRVNISFNFSCVIVHNCICGKRSDPSRPTQGVFSSSAVQTPASLSGSIWSLRWSCFGASCCHLLDVCSERTLECLLSRTIFQFYSELYFVFSISVYVNSNKRGQTSRPVPGPEVQANCNFEENICGRYYLLDFKLCLFNSLR